MHCWHDCGDGTQWAVGRDSFYLWPLYTATMIREAMGISSGAPHNEGDVRPLGLRVEAKSARKQHAWARTPSTSMLLERPAYHVPFEAVYETVGGSARPTS